jgi:hypothetical protein
MPYIARNISGGYKILLKHQIPPGGSLDLEEVFEGFCKPKRSKKAQEAKHAEWSPDQFPEFLERVETEYARDRGTWQLDFSEGPRTKKGAVAERKKAAAKESFPKEENSRLQRKEEKKQTIQASRKKIRRALDGDMSPKELAWLKMSEETKKIIDNCNDALVIKHAVKLARNIAGQERVRDLLERRLIELSDRLGIA